ncbi:hypothetical protein Q8F55_007583 [Vanrija albida]|uniref:NADPH-dependent FMN reductase-like domain-containing protein n=1 Tax=Vanrija albida TaxID=181172 RepID=A0ABR3PUY3_9TREE
MSAPTIALVLGSPRTPSNTSGLGVHLARLLAARGVSVATVHLATSVEQGHPLPFGPVSLPPAATGAGVARARLPETHADPSVRLWSAAVLAFDAVLLLSPEYNAGLPAPLKAALDALYYEWRGLPAALVACGTGGGANVLASAPAVLASLGADLVDERVGITLPQAALFGEWVTGDEGWLRDYDDALAPLLDSLVAKATAFHEQRTATADAAAPAHGT